MNENVVPLVIADNRETIDEQNINAKWHSWRVGNLPHTALPAQVSDMKVAFFAGAAAVCGIFEVLGTIEDMDAGQKMVDKLADDLTAFARNGGA